MTVPATDDLSPRHARIVATATRSRVAAFMGQVSTMHRARCEPVLMRVHSDRRHQFEVSRSELWAAITRVDRYSTWWPWLRDFDAIDLKPGARWRCRVHPPLPYSLHLVVTIDDVVAETSVTTTVGGDVEGSATLLLLDTADGSEARLTSDLAPSSRVLQIITRAATPVVRFGHDWVLDTGARQFRDRAL